MVPGIAIVGGGIPLAAGMALALKMQKSPGIVACFFGDGAVAEGAFHEGVNLAAIWDLPVVFVCENNLYGASTRVDLVMRNPRIADRGAAYGIRGETVDGNDVLAVYEATRSAAAECRRGQGPVLLELLTYRRTGHSRRDACHYQAKDEREAWFARDPIERLGQLLIERGFARPIRSRQRANRAQRGFQAAVERARQQPMPSVDDLTTDVSGMNDVGGCLVDFNRFDVATKELVWDDPPAWLGRFGFVCTGAVDVIDSDITTLTASADKVIRVPEPEPYLVDIELQSYHDLDLVRTLWYRQVAPRLPPWSARAHCGRVAPQGSKFTPFERKIRTQPTGWIPGELL